MSCARFLTLAVIATVPSMAHAYETTGVSWRMSSYPNGVPVCPASDRAIDANTEALKASFRKAVLDAIYAWTDTGNSVDVPGMPCSAFRINETTCSGSPYPGSSQPWIYWEANWGSVGGVGASTIGVTPYSYSPFSAEITEAKIIMNDRNYYWDTNGINTDVGSITAHEFGHFIGLDHYDEFSFAKQQECFNSVNYPSVMCAAYVGGVGRIPSADDTLGGCYLYPKNGALGSACTDGGQCNSGVCHGDGYCSDTCMTAGDCPLGYTCPAGQCERDVPPPSCPMCGDLPCDAMSSTCIGASGGGFCTPYCTPGSCPTGFFCASLQGGGAVCWPISNTCSQQGPGPGQACTGQGECALGNICLQINQAGATRCFEVCAETEDCPDGQRCNSTNDPELSYCEVAACGCDTDFACQSGCACDIDCNCMCNTTLDCDSGCSCDPHCNQPPPCSCNTTNGCDGGCPCDPDCSAGCGCDVGPTCDTTCACDPNCLAPAACDCDETFDCDPNCPCDVECICACDETFSCDDDCICDPECDGCLSAAIIPTPGNVGRTGMGAVGILLLVLGLRRRRRGGG